MKTLKQLNEKQENNKNLITFSSKFLRFFDCSPENILVSSKEISLTLIKKMASDIYLNVKGIFEKHTFIPDENFRSIFLKILNKTKQIINNEEVLKIIGFLNLNNFLLSLFKYLSWQLSSPIWLCPEEACSDEELKFKKQWNIFRDYINKRELKITTEIPKLIEDIKLICSKDQVIKIDPKSSLDFNLYEIKFFSSNLHHLPTNIKMIISNLKSSTNLEHQQGLMNTLWDQLKSYHFENFISLSKADKAFCKTIKSHLQMCRNKLSAHQELKQITASDVATSFAFFAELLFTIIQKNEKGKNYE